jgi:hypothetical protein
MRKVSLSCTNRKLDLSNFDIYTHDPNEDKGSGDYSDRPNPPVEPETANI